MNRFKAPVRRGCSWSGRRRGLLGILRVRGHSPSLRHHGPEPDAGVGPYGRIRADHRSRGHAGALRDPRPRPDHGPFSNDGPVADDRPVFDHGPAADLRTPPDPGAVLDVGEVVDPGVASHEGAAADSGPLPYDDVILDDGLSVDVGVRADHAVLADHGVRPLSLLPPSCGHITHDEVCLLSLCCATQSGRNTSARRQARALGGAVWSPFLFASVERLTCVLARRSLLLSSAATAMRCVYH